MKKFLPLLLVVAVVCCLGVSPAYAEARPESPTATVMMIMEFTDVVSQSDGAATVDLKIDPESPLQLRSLRGIIHCASPLSMFVTHTPSGEFDFTDYSVCWDWTDQDLTEVYAQPIANLTLNMNDAPGGCYLIWMDITEAISLDGRNCRDEIVVNGGTIFEPGRNSSAIVAQCDFYETYAEHQSSRAVRAYATVATRQAGAVYAAIYDRHGRMIEVRNQLVDIGVTPVKFEFACTHEIDENCKLRFFVTDMNHAPIMEAIQLSLRSGMLAH